MSEAGLVVHTVITGHYSFIVLERWAVTLYMTPAGLGGSLMTQTFQQLFSWGPSSGSISGGHIHSGVFHGGQ